MTYDRGRVRVSLHGLGWRKRFRFGWKHRPGAGSVGLGWAVLSWMVRNG